MLFLCIKAFVQILKNKMSLLVYTVADLQSSPPLSLLGSVSSEDFSFFLFFYKIKHAHWIWVSGNVEVFESLEFPKCSQHIMQSQSLCRDELCQIGKGKKCNSF